mmetsp:Transcript_7729/g.25643  ORF Transcript_7729/g.25643 Transcript_7729/m.25643 type:complete len:208 (-) Transcript_7729:82-705(-)
MKSTSLSPTILSMVSTLTSTDRPPFHGTKKPSCSDPTGSSPLSRARLSITWNGAVPVKLLIAMLWKEMRLPTPLSAIAARMRSTLNGTGSKDITSCPAFAYAIASDPSYAPISSTRPGGACASVASSADQSPPGQSATSAPYSTTSDPDRDELACRPAPLCADACVERKKDTLASRQRTSAASAAASLTLLAGAERDLIVNRRWSVD